MLLTCQLTVQGGNTHLVALHRLEALQSLVTELGAAHFPLFLRIGGSSDVRLQPITARTLLAEVERFSGELKRWEISGIRFHAPDDNELGVMYSRAGGPPLSEGARSRLYVGEQGIRFVVASFPPPVGFRSAPDLPAGEYECFFDSLTSAGPGWLGHRTEAMAGSGSPVRLEHLPLPPVTRWDYSRVAGNPPVHRLQFVQSPASEAFRNIIHAFESACTDSLRLKHPLRIRLD